MVHRWGQKITCDGDLDGFPQTSMLGVPNVNGQVQMLILAALFA